MFVRKAIPNPSETAPYNH